MADTATYSQILKSSRKAIVEAKKAGDDVSSQQIAELFGIYYNAFAGMLRNRHMYKKEVDTDGYPKIVITIEGVPYSCKDVALRDILKEDYEALTSHPFNAEEYEDSYVHPYLGSIHLIDDYKAPDAAAGSDQALGNKIPRRNQGGQGSARPGDDADRRYSETERKLKQMETDKRGFQYDPNYDHYYSDRLPDLLKELDSNVLSGVFRVLCMLLSGGGIAYALTFLR